MAKLTKKRRKNLRKNIKVNQVSENKFLSKFLKGFKKQLANLRKLYSEENYNNYFNILNYLDFKNLDKMANGLSNDILRKNHNGFLNILSALTEGLEQDKKQKKLAQEYQTKFKKGVNSLYKEKQLFKPLMNKFTTNVSKIRNVTSDVQKILKKAYEKGESLRGTEFENLLYDKLKNRAKLVIRTESSKINAALTEVRSQSLGIKAYFWSSSKDQKTRPSHQKMDGVLVFWNDTPQLDKMVGHAGEYPNCRCTSLPIFELDDIQFPVKVAENLQMESKYDKKLHKYNGVNIVRGRIKTYNKKEFLDRYGIYFK